MCPVPVFEGVRRRSRALDECYDPLPRVAVLFMRSYAAGDVSLRLHRKANQEKQIKEKKAKEEALVRHVYVCGAGAALVACPPPH